MSNALGQITSKKESSGKTLKLAKNRLLLFIASLTGGLIIWQLAILLFDLPSFILPGPIQVIKRFITAIQGGLIQRHLFITLLEVLLGLSLGTGFAIITGYILAKSPSAEKLASPYLIASQSIPIVAIAPLLVIWFGPGLLSKVLICSLIVFFPVLINTVVGLREVPQDLHYLMRSLGSTPFKTLYYLEIPAALPIFFGGLRVGATLAVIGAIVGELVGSDRGLGFLINVGRGQYDTALVFVAVITLVVMASSLYGFVLLLESRLLSWQTWRK
ncbi:MAG: ABC transporter permease [Anaerolineaceae bacterium]|nr:ABC transporter permease [Anaerolineaceae bacterium]